MCQEKASNARKQGSCIWVYDTLELGEQKADDDEYDRRRRGDDAVRPEDRPTDEPFEGVTGRGLCDLRCACNQYMTQRIQI